MAVAVMIEVVVAEEGSSDCGDRGCRLRVSLTPSSVAVVSHDKCDPRLRLAWALST